MTPMARLSHSSWPGLIPAIHALLAETLRKDVDARDKPGA